MAHQHLSSHIGRPRARFLRAVPVVTINSRRVLLVQLSLLATMLTALVLAPMAQGSSPVDTIGLYEGRNGMGDVINLNGVDTQVTSEPHCDTAGGCAVTEFERDYLNGRSVSTVLDFLNNDHFLPSGPPSTRLNAWNDIVNTNHDELVLSVVMIPADRSTCNNAAGNPDGGFQETVPNGPNNCLFRGAQGDYDGYWKALANSLLANGLSHVIIRPGWEMNGKYGTLQRWSAICRPNDYVAYWQRIVDDMNGVNGGISGPMPPDFEYAWSPHLGNQPSFPNYINPDKCQINDGTFTPNKAYPGPDYVDYIGSDAYNNNVKSWNDPNDGTDTVLNKDGYGLSWLANYATVTKDKRIALPEWGVLKKLTGTVYPQMDRAEFIRKIYEWIRTHDVSFANYFDRDQGDTSQTPPTQLEYWYALRHFPAAADAYRNAFGRVDQRIAGAPLNTLTPLVTTTRITSTPTTCTGSVTGKVVANPPYDADGMGDGYNYVNWLLQRHRKDLHAWVNWYDPAKFFLQQNVNPATGNFSAPLQATKPWDENGYADGITDKPLGDGTYRVRADFSNDTNTAYLSSESAWTKFYLTGC